MPVSQFKPKKVKVLHFDGNRTFQFRTMLQEGMSILDDKRSVGWRITPNSKVPILQANKDGTKKLLCEAFFVTEWSADAFMPDGQYPGGPRSWEWRNAMTVVSNKAARQYSTDNLNYSLMAVLLLSAVLAVVAIVILLTSDVGGIL